MKTPDKSAVVAVLLALAAYAHFAIAAALETWGSVPAFVTLFNRVGVACCFFCFLATLGATLPRIP